MYSFIYCDLHILFRWPRIKPSDPLDITVQKFDGSDLTNVNLNFKMKGVGEETFENVSKKPE